MTKLIAIDLDGTLLNEKSEISENNKQALLAAQAQGIEVVIATGRAHFDVQTIFKDTNMKTWIIGANGATIHRPNGELFHHLPMKHEDALESLNWLEQEGFYYEIFSNEAILTPQNGRERLTIEMDRVLSGNPNISVEELEQAINKQFSQTGFSYIDSHKEVSEMGIDIYNILAFSFDEAKLNRGWEQFKDHNDLTIVSSANHNFELEHKNASKGNALAILANKLGIHIADTAAVGDSFNDLSMLTTAGRSAAMGNAPDAIKEAAGEVTLSNHENGVAHFINSLRKQ